MQHLLSAPPRDRRAAARFQPAFGTVVRLGPSGTRRALGLVWDVSATGLSLLTAAPLEPGERYQAELAAEDGATVAVELDVAHARAVSTGDFFVGARFARPLPAKHLVPFVAPALADRQPAARAC